VSAAGTAKTVAAVASMASREDFIAEERGRLLFVFLRIVTGLEGIQSELNIFLLLLRSYTGFYTTKRDLLKPLFSMIPSTAFVSAG
jgi:hypothetical protein